MMLLTDSFVSGFPGALVKRDASTTSRGEIARWYHVISHYTTNNPENAQRPRPCPRISPEPWPAPAGMEVTPPAPAPLPPPLPLPLLRSLSSTAVTSGRRLVLAAGSESMHRGQNFHTARGVHPAIASPRPIPRTRGCSSRTGTPPRLGFGRVVVSKIEGPNMLVNMV